MKKLLVVACGLAFSVSAPSFAGPEKGEKPTKEAPDKPTKEAPDKPTKEAPDKPTKEAPGKPTKEAPDKPTKEAAERNAERANRERQKAEIDHAAGRASAEQLKEAKEKAAAADRATGK